MSNFEIIDLLPEGSYFVGDVSCLASEIYIEGLEEALDDIFLSHETGIFKISLENKNEETVDVYLFFASTSDGDGIYFDQHKREYPVDSGTIGAFLLAEPEFEAMANKLMKEKMGTVIHCGYEFEPFKGEDGLIVIDKIEIETENAIDYEMDDEEGEEENW